MNNSIKWALLASVLLLAAPSLLSAKQIIVVRVDGLSCAFCAYGLEKKLSELEGVEKVQINIKNGTAVLTVKENTTITDETIRKTVKDSGFTPKKISREQSTSVKVEKGRVSVLQLIDAVEKAGRFRASLKQ